MWVTFPSSIYGHVPSVCQKLKFCPQQLSETKILIFPKFTSNTPFQNFRHQRWTNPCQIHSENLISLKYNVTNTREQKRNILNSLFLAQIQCARFRHQTKKWNNFLSSYIFFLHGLGQHLLSLFYSCSPISMYRTQYSASHRTYIWCWCWCWWFA